MLRAFIVLFSVTVAGNVYAAPPVIGSEDYDQLSPYANWITKQSAPNGAPCCSISDCRFVSYRANSGTYEAFIASADGRGYTKFPDAPNTWLPVPDGVIKREVNPTGRAIACWSSRLMKNSGFFCFFLPDLS